MSRRTLTNIYGYRQGGDVYCPKCDAPQGAKELKLVRVGSVCPTCDNIYSGRGVWVPKDKALIVPNSGPTTQTLAERFSDIDPHVRRVEIDRVHKASLYDLLQYEVGAKNPHDSWNKMSKQFPEVLAFSENLFIFSGQGQKPTPVVSLKEWLRILMLSKKPIGTEVRQVASEVLEDKLNEVMGVVKDQGDQFQKMFSAVVGSFREQFTRMQALEDKLESPLYNSIRLTEADVLLTIRGLFESTWKTEFQKRGLIENDEAWEDFNKKWKAVNSGAHRGNWKLRHYIAAVVHIRASYNIDLWPTVLGPFIVKMDGNKLLPPKKSVVRPLRILTARGNNEQP